MIKIIMGRKGSGKTKAIAALANEAVKSEKGNIVFLERGNKLTYDIHISARLVDTKHYQVEGFERFVGFIYGLAAGNYDITHIFIDSVFKIVKSEDMGLFEKFLGELEVLSNESNINFTMTISAEAEAATDLVKKYF